MLAMEIISLGFLSMITRKANKNVLDCLPDKLLQENIDKFNNTVASHFS